MVNSVRGANRSDNRGSRLSSYNQVEEQSESWKYLVAHSQSLPGDAGLDCRIAEMRATRLGFRSAFAHVKHEV